MKGARKRSEIRNGVSGNGVSGSGASGNGASGNGASGNVLERASASVRASERSEQAGDENTITRTVCLVLEAGRQTREGIYMR